MNLKNRLAIIFILSNLREKPDYYRFCELYLLFCIYIDRCFYVLRPLVGGRKRPSFTDLKLYSH